MKRRVIGSVTLGLLAVTAITVVANNITQDLPFAQDWTNVGLITTNDDWNTPGVPGVIGYLGDSDPAGTVTAVDPRTLTADVPVAIDVVAQHVTSNTSGGVGEFELGNPTIGMQGSGTADAPYIKLHVNTAKKANIVISYNVRDIDGTLDNSVQQCVAQYRVGSSGAWTNIASTYVADATTGPSLATLVTPVTGTLGTDADRQSAPVEIRIMTTNAASNDEWIGIDDITVTGSEPAVPGSQPFVLVLLAALIAGTAVWTFRSKTAADRT